MALRKEGYWDNHYREELENYVQNGDEGEIWFGIRLTRRIVDWLLLRIKDQEDFALLDIGCGNAALLCMLVERMREEALPQSEGHIKLVGVDYSKESIALAKRVVDDRNLLDKITLHQADILNPSCAGYLRIRYQYLVDKGTLDAICLLNSDTAEKLLQTKISYLESIYSLAEEGSVFLLASCNNTEDELLSLFDIRCRYQRHAKLIDKIETPKITYGGKEGSQVSCIIIKFGSEVAQSGPSKSF